LICIKINTINAQLLNLFDTIIIIMELILGVLVIFGVGWCVLYFIKHPVKTVSKLLSILFTLAVGIAVIAGLIYLLIKYQ